MRWKPFLKGIVTKLWSVLDALETLFEGNCNEAVSVLDALETLFEGNCNEVVNVSRMKKGCRSSLLVTLEMS